MHLNSYTKIRKFLYIVTPTSVPYEGKICFPRYVIHFFKWPKLTRIGGRQHTLHYIFYSVLVYNGGGGVEQNNLKNSRGDKIWGGDETNGKMIGDNLAGGFKRGYLVNVADANICIIDCVMQIG